MKRVIFGRERSGVCFGKLEPCSYVELLPSELRASPPCEAGTAPEGSANLWIHD